MILEISHFGGIAPKKAPHLLGAGEAQDCINAIPVDGNLRAVGDPGEGELSQFPVMSIFSGDRIYAWEYPGVTAATTPSGTSEYRYVAADAENGARIFEPTADTRDWDRPAKEWFAGMPRPHDENITIQDIAQNDLRDADGVVFYGVAINTEWDGVVYQGNMRTIAVRAAANHGEVRLSFALAGINGSGVTAAEKDDDTGDWHLTMNMRPYVRVGEKMTCGDCNGVVTQILDDTDGGSPRLAVKFDTDIYESLWSPRLILSPPGYALRVGNSNFDFQSADAAINVPFPTADTVAGGGTAWTLRVKMPGVAEREVATLNADGESWDVSAPLTSGANSYAILTATKDAEAGGLGKVALMRRVNIARPALGTSDGTAFADSAGNLYN